VLFVSFYNLLVSVGDSTPVIHMSSIIRVDSVGGSTPFTSTSVIFTPLIFTPVISTPVISSAPVISELLVDVCFHLSVLSYFASSSSPVKLVATNNSSRNTMACRIG